MIRQSRLLHASVVERDTKKILGRLRSIDYTLASKDVLGLTYYKMNLLRSSVFVPVQNIDSLGDFITVRQPRIRMKRPKQRFDLDERVEAVDADGNPIGYVVDCFFEESGQRIAALEISQGFFEDIISGRLRAGSFSQMSYANRVIVETLAHQTERGE